MRIVQKGTGDVRPLLVCYFVSMELDDPIRLQVTPNTTIVNFTFPPNTGKYTAIGAHNPRLADLMLQLADELQCDGFGPTVLLGFSEGCGGLRTQLLANQKPWAIIAIDGIHSSQPPADWQIDPWRKWAYACGATLGPDGLGKEPVKGKPFLRVTFSQIQPPTYRSVRQTMEQVCAWGAMPPRESYPKGDPMWPGVPEIYRSGNFELWSWPGNDAAAHVYQAVAILPGEVWQIANKLGFAAGGTGPVDTKPPVELPVVTYPKAPSGKVRIAIAAVPVAATIGATIWSVYK